MRDIIVKRITPQTFCALAPIMPVMTSREEGQAGRKIARTSRAIASDANVPSDPEHRHCVQLRGPCRQQDRGYIGVSKIPSPRSAASAMMEPEVGRPTPPPAGDDSVSPIWPARAPALVQLPPQPAPAADHADANAAFQGARRRHYAKLPT